MKVYFSGNQLLKGSGLTELETALRSVVEVVDVGYVKIQIYWGYHANGPSIQLSSDLPVCIVAQRIRALFAQLRIQLLSVQL